MENIKYNVISRKIQIRVHSETTEERNKGYERLRYFSDTSRNAANDVINQQHFNYIIQERIFLYDEKLREELFVIESTIDNFKQRKIDTVDIKERKKIDGEIKVMYSTKMTFFKKLNEKVKECLFNLGTKVKDKPSNEPYILSTYQLLSNKYPNLPSDIRSILNKIVVSAYRKDLKGIMKGEKSIRTYKSFPICFSKDPLKQMKYDEDEKNYKFNLFKIPLITVLGADKSNNKIVIERALSGEYIICDSTITKKNDKWFLNFVVKVPVLNIESKENNAVGVDIGRVVPLMLTATEDKWGKMIGNQKQLFDKKRSFQKQKSSIQSTLSQTKGGKGYNRKMRRLETIRSSEHDYTETMLHTYAKQVIDFAIKTKSSIIKMEYLKSMTKEDQKEKFMIRFWPIARLQNLIEEKAKKYGIFVVYVDPYHTSQTCSCCDHYEEGQRHNQSDFYCKNNQCEKYGKKQNADRNASLNILKSTNIVTSEKETMFHKLYVKNMVEDLVLSE